MTTLFQAPHIKLRAELRLALLAAAEACWLYAIALTLGTLSGLPRQISPLGIFIVYWAALLAGRVLPRSDVAWRALQLLTVAFAFVAILIAFRVGFYTNVALFDFSWLPQYVGRVLAFFERVTAEEISTIVLIAAFLRGLSFAQRPLTLWVVGFQFRLGIVVFFVIALIAALTVNINFIFWMFAYFALSLLAIALARIEEAGQERPLGATWAVVMCAAIGVTMLVGFAATQFLTLNAVHAFFEFLSPLQIVLQLVIALIAIPFLFLLDWLIRALGPLFDRMFQMINNIFPRLNLGNPNSEQVISAVTQQLVNLLPYLRLLGIILVILFIGWLVARALNRRVKWQEHEMYVRETLDERDALQSDQRKRTPAAHTQPHHIHAENIRRIYAALQAHARTLGLPRRDAETPLEFLPRLIARFPDSADALTAITNAYVAVHYAQQQATDAQVRAVRATWQRVKQQMTNDRGRTIKA
jgi:MFS family permease